MQAGQWKYCITQMSYSVYKWGLVKGQEISLFWEFKLSVSSFFFHEFGEFCEICTFGKILEFWETHGFHNHCLGTGYATGCWW